MSALESPYDSLAEALDEEYDESLAADEEKVAIGAAPAFAIHEDGAADWALRKIMHGEWRRREVEDLYREQLNRLRHWKDREDERLAHSEQFFAGHLAAYMARRTEADPKLKTLRLPHGNLTARTQQPVWEFTDEPAFIEWADASCPELVRVKKEAALSEAKKVLAVAIDAATPPLSTLFPTFEGEEVPGVVVTTRPVKFSAHVNVDSEEAS